MEVIRPTKSPFSGEILLFPDLDECADQTHNCSSNATCTNAIGSFSCTCIGGYLGDGFNCTGQSQFEMKNSWPWRPIPEEQYLSDIELLKWCVNLEIFTSLFSPENSYGLKPETAGRSCKDIKNQTSTSEDKEYWINTNSSMEPFKAFCDMTTDGGRQFFLCARIHDEIMGSRRNVHAFQKDYTALLGKSRPKSVRAHETSIP